MMKKVAMVAPEAIRGWLEAHGSELEAIVHMGAISSTTEADADLIVEVNFRLSLDLWRWCAANGKRLMILCSLAEGELSVGALNDRIELSQSALSQHLAKLRDDGMVSTRREERAQSTAGVR